MFFLQPQGKSVPDKQKEKATRPVQSWIGKYAYCKDKEHWKKEFPKGTGAHIPMFFAALFIITKLWKQPRCPTTDK
jgi:hypothetical protein